MVPTYDRLGGETFEDYRAAGTLFVLTARSAPPMRSTFNNYSGQKPGLGCRNPPHKHQHDNYRRPKIGLPHARGQTFRRNRSSPRGALRPTGLFSVGLRYLPLPKPDDAWRAMAVVGIVIRIEFVHS
jgi:hypothetical protein